MTINTETCYIHDADGNGTTEYTFQPCHVTTWDGRLAFTPESIADTVARNEATTTVPPTPTIATLPETGSEGVLLVAAVCLVSLGSLLVKVAQR